MACQGYAQGAEGWDSHSPTSLPRMENPEAWKVLPRNCMPEVAKGLVLGDRTLKGRLPKPSQGGEEEGGQVRPPGTSFFRQSASDF